MTDEDPQIELSPLSRTITSDGFTVDVLIYRLAGDSFGWTLEVVDQEHASTVWDDVFATDQAAFAEFNEVLQTEGIRSFFEQPPSPTKH